MYKVTAYFKNRTYTETFKNLYDAIEAKDNADAYYPIRVTLEGVFSMKEWVYDCWNSVMDDERNPLSNIPDFSTRHMIMQILAWMWCITFSFIVGSLWIGIISMMVHVVLLGAIAVTVATFETAKRNPIKLMNFANGYTSYGRGRNYTIYRDKDGNAHKVKLPEGDPGGEHE